MGTSLPGSIRSARNRSATRRSSRCGSSRNSTPELQCADPASVLRVHVPGDTLADVLPQLAETYCSTIAYELEHLSDHQQRVWLRQAIESSRYRQPLLPDEKKALFRRLCEVEGMERFLRKRFLGQKQFSLEGLDVMIPMLDETIELAAEAGAHDVVMGMAHRGRLNVLAHTIGMPYEYILREFEGERTSTPSPPIRRAAPAT